jgi:hypothetical protein
MLIEIPHPKQNPGEPHRRWFYDSDHGWDLIVWEQAQHIVGFQLCYKNDEGHECALTWKADQGFSHDQVDNGENRPGKPKSTPVLMPDGLFDDRLIPALFKAYSHNIEPELARFIYDKLCHYPHLAVEPNTLL